MPKKPFTFWGLLPPQNDNDLTWVLRNCIVGLLLFTFSLIIFVACISKISWVDRVIAYLAVAGACVLIGGAAGFLFGIPRADKNRFKADADHAQSENYYSDNTNLEDISDWLTKIIVGLTLVKFQTILGWLNNAANSMAASLKVNITSGSDYFVFSYGVIVLYILAGGMMAYLWTRINFSKILTYNRKHLRDIELSKTEQAAGLRLLNKDLVANNEVGSMREVSTEMLNNFKQTVKVEYESRPIKDKTDLQKGRWGNQRSRNNFLLDAEVEKQFIPGLYSLTLKVIGKGDSANNGLVAFFLHDTFPQQIVYVPFNAEGVAILELTCYEAFTVGAMVEQGLTELEMDLNDIPGFPKGFYWSRT